METKNRAVSILLSLNIIFAFFSCTHPEAENGSQLKIENTFKSVSLFQDSISVDLAQVKTTFDRMNAVIEEIGYPDAGYQVWLVSGKDSIDFRIMVEGHWPDHATYQLIHDHPSYKSAGEVAGQQLKALKSVWYHRFTRVN